MSGSQGTVVAVSVAKPQWQTMFGRRVYSSIVRDPAPGRIYFATEGPENNATAVHTEQVYACFSEHYAHWARELGIDRSEWPDCYWGENLMLSGLEEHTLHIGDRYRIGGAVLEVTSPRIPCFKLCWRLGQPESFLPTLIADGRMGCYFRVIEAGHIGAGDAIVRLEIHPGNISVMTLSRLLFDPSVTDVDYLRRVAATPGLGHQASEMLRKRITHLTDGQLGREHRWQGWRPFRVARIEDEAEGVKSFYLEPEDDGDIPAYRAGQFVSVRLPPEAGNVVRTWSLSDYGAGVKGYRVTVKREHGGSGSVYLHDRLQSGDRLALCPPGGRFVLDRGGLLRTVLISAGIGVTPLLAMLKAHLERGGEAPPLLWVHSARCGRHHALRAETETLLGGAGVQRRIHYSQPGAGDVAGRDYDRAGRIDEATIVAMLEEEYTMRPFGRDITLTGDNSDFYLCGPESFLSRVRDTLVAHGVNPAQIHAESFRSSRPSLSSLGSPGDVPETSKVVFRRSGRTLTWRREEDLSLLELAEAHELRVESGCRMGTCGTCEATLLVGEVDYAAAPLIEPGAGTVLLCCARPQSARVELDC